MLITLTDTQYVEVSFQPVDARGNPARVEGVPEWQVSDPFLLALNIAEDGLSAELLAMGPLGNGQMAITVDADLGAGVRSITGVLDVTITSGAATSLNIVVGVPQEQA